VKGVSNSIKSIFKLGAPKIRVIFTPKTRPKVDVHTKAAERENKRHQSGAAGSAVA